MYAGRPRGGENLCRRGVKLGLVWGECLIAGLENRAGLPASTGVYSVISADREMTFARRARAPQARGEAEGAEGLGRKRGGAGRS